MASAPARAKLPAGAVAWSLFEAARIPLVILVSIYVFTPYFAAVMIGDPVQGQAAVAQSGKWGGWIVALTAPLLGAALDRYGPRKPFLGLVTALLVTITACYWFARPDLSGLSVAQVIAMAAANTVLYAYSDLGQNSLLSRAAPGLEYRASGLALGLGNALSTAALVFVLFAFVLPATPLFGLDRAAHEPDRISGPIAAAIMALGCLPLFLLTPDAPRTGLSPLAALKAGFGDLRSLFAGARSQRDPLVFLAARMLYTDATVAIILFGGVYAAGVLGWRTRELLAYGVLLSLFAVAGGFLAILLDGRLGAKRSLQVQIVAIFLAQLANLGIRRDEVFYLPITPGVRVWNSPLFATLPEIAYLGVGFIIAAGVTATYASSRSLLVALIPPDAGGRFFGLYTLSGNLTYWLAPTLIQIFTLWFATQQAGFIPVLGLLLAGLIVLSFVRGGLPSGRA